MKPSNTPKPNRLAAFTLIELLVVVTIIAVLTALIFPVVGALKVKRSRSIAYAELEQMKTMIESYKQKKNFYPPGNPTNGLLSALYFELAGSLLSADGASYVTLDGVGRISTNDLKAAFNVDGIVNSAREGQGGDEESAPVSFLKGLRPAQVGDLRTNAPGLKVLVCSEEWTGDQIVADPWDDRATRGLNPWRYNAMNPTNNPGSYDLWIDIMIAGETNRISNWSKTPQIIK